MGQIAAPNIEWVNAYGSPLFDQGMHIVSNDLNEVITIGNFSDTIDFDASSSINRLVGSHAKRSSYFINKYGPNGKLIWARSISSGGSNLSINAITVDHLGNIYIGGSCGNNTDFDPNLGNAISRSNYSSINGFLLKLSNRGTYQWHRLFEGPGTASVNDIKVNNNQEIFVIGEFTDSIDFNSQIGAEDFRTSNGESDIFISKFNNVGQTVHTLSLGSNGSDKGLNLVIDNFNNLIIGGEFSNTVDFDPSTSVNHLQTTNQSSNAFIAKFDTQLNFVWAHNIASTLQSWTIDIEIDTVNNIYIFGSFIGQGDFNPDIRLTMNMSTKSASCFLSKFSSNGIFNWSKKILYDGFSYLGSPNHSKPLSLFKDKLYLGGTFNGTITFDSLTSNSILNSSNLNDAALTTFDTSGNFLWYKHFSGNDSAQILSTTVDQFGTLYLTGYYKDSTYFDSSSTYLVKPYGGRDIFLLRIGDCLDPIDTTLNASITTLSSNEINADSYQWLVCNYNFVELNGVDQASFSPNFNTYYAVEIKKGACVDTSECAMLKTVGLDKNSSKSLFQIYPNPSQGNVTIVNTDNMRSTVLLELFSFQGKLINTFLLKGKSSHLDLSELKSGIYFLKSNDYIQKLIIE